MKKILFALLIIFSFNCSSTEKVNNTVTNDKTKNKIVYFDFTGVLNKKQINFINKNYDWDSGKLLIINFTQPRSYCHFDNHKRTSQSVKWWHSFYSKINIENCSNIFVVSNGYRNKDKDNFLLNNFFNRKKSCFGVMVINGNGLYLQFNGHYSENQVSKFIEKLSMK